MESFKAAQLFEEIKRIKSQSIKAHPKNNRSLAQSQTVSHLQQKEAATQSTRH